MVDAAQAEGAAPVEAVWEHAATREPVVMTPSEIDDHHAFASMRLVGFITAANGDRPTNERRGSGA